MPFCIPLFECASLADLSSYQRSLYLQVQDLLQQLAIAAMDVTPTPTVQILEALNNIVTSRDVKAYDFIIASNGDISSTDLHGSQVD